MTKMQPIPEGSPTMSDFRELKLEVSGVGEKVAQLDGKVARMDEKIVQMDGTLTRVAKSVARLEGDMFEVRRDVSELKGLRIEFGRFQTTLDGVVRTMEALDRWCRSQGSMLMDHERRIGTLESGLP
ncbi:MAG: hypothetical protein HY403_07510 [Elusimicrobia bacterium]|nr:hypothetical protein [Elusimicrobiota bacterium]